MALLIVIFTIVALSAVVFTQRTSSLRMHRLVEVGLIIALAAISLLYFNLFVRDGYTRSSLTETQKELRELAGLLGHELSPAKLELLAKTQRLPFKRMETSLHANIPSGSSAYRCGKLTFFFDANENLVDVRGHLLNHSLLNSDQPNKPDHRTPDPR
ncbi:MAG: hypothetical protein JHC85_09620 [Chthoniobacterales bacterium]|nr:hypothetical protein [Chthoniobacterales bacterium]